MAEALLQYETIDREMIEAIMDGRVPDRQRIGTVNPAVVEAVARARGSEESPIGGPATQSRDRPPLTEPLRHLIKRPPIGGLSVWS